MLSNQAGTKRVVVSNLQSITPEGRAKCTPMAATWTLSKAPAIYRTVVCIQREQCEQMLVEVSEHCLPSSVWPTASSGPEPAPHVN